MLRRQAAIEIKAWRLRAGLTQAELARRLGVVRSAVCHWERGSTALSLATLERIADVCGARVTLLSEPRRRADA